MPENSVNMQDSNNRCCGCNNEGFLNGLFGGNDSEILFFIIIFQIFNIINLNCFFYIKV